MGVTAHPPIFSAQARATEDDQASGQPISIGRPILPARPGSCHGPRAAPFSPPPPDAGRARSSIGIGIGPGEG